MSRPILEKPDILALCHQRMDEARAALPQQAGASADFERICAALTTAAESYHFDQNIRAMSVAKETARRELRPLLNDHLITSVIDAVEMEVNATKAGAVASR